MTSCYRMSKYDWEINMSSVLCDCGAVLVEDVSDVGVTPLGGEPITFRRDTDYVVCANCHKVYKAKTLLAGGSLAESLVDEREGQDARDAIDALERMVEDDD
jgi:hypothetical protein